MERKEGNERIVASGRRQEGHKATQRWRWCTKKTKVSSIIMGEDRARMRGKVRPRKNEVGKIEVEMKVRVKE